MISRVRISNYRSVADRGAAYLAGTSRSVGRGWSQWPPPTRFHWGKHDVSTRRIGLVIFEVIWKMRLIFNGEHWSFHLETGYDPHTFFQNLRNNDKKRKAQIVSGSKSKISKVFRHSNIKVSSLITLVGAPDTRITVLYEQVLTPRGNDHSRYLNSI